MEIGEQKEVENNKLQKNIYRYLTGTPKNVENVESVESTK